MEFVDTHAHIYLEDFKEDILDVLGQAQKNKVHKIFMPNIDSSSIDDIENLEKSHPETCFAMMGLHPCYVKNNYKEELRVMESKFEERKYAALGEVGIDLYWDKSTFEIQKIAFQTQISWAKSLDLPIIIHSRDSLDETIQMIQDNQDGSLTGIFHCFNGNLEQAKKIIDTGFLMGIGGVVTFKKAGVDLTVAEIPLEHLVLETDAPYLSPTPFRGKRNLPEYIPIIADKVAELHDVKTAHVAELTSKNALSLFHKYL